MRRPHHGIAPERWFSSGEVWATATFLVVQVNPYVVLTLRLFQAQLLAARARGEAERAEAFEAAIRSLREDSTSGSELTSVSQAAPVAN